jgi:AcrR family transcriptional regulator
VGIGSLYQYFPDREAILAALVDRYLDEMWQVIDAALDPGETDIAVIVRRLVAATLRAHAARPRLHQAVIAVLGDTGQEERVQAAERRLMILVRAAFVLRRDELGPTELDLAAFLVVQTAIGLTFAAMVRQPERLLDPAMTDEITALIVRYLAPRR